MTGPVKSPPATRPGILACLMIIAIAMLAFAAFAALIWGALHAVSPGS